MKKILLPSIALLIIIAGCNQPNAKNNKVSNSVTSERPDKALETSSQATPATESTIIELKDGDTFALTASEVEKEIAGSKHKMLAYNGSIPGPVIKVMQGSTITIDFKNNTNIDALLHSHGIRLDNKFDGTHLTQENITPGESFKYQITFPDEGIYWYHPHFREDLTQDQGLYGNFIVVPQEKNYWNPVNREEFLVLDDVLIKDGSLVPHGKELATHTLMGRFGNTMLINGSDNYNLKVDQGEVIRFYITNTANTRHFKLKIPGAKLKLVGSDIGKYEKEEFIEDVIIAPAERYVVEAYFPDSGSFEFQNNIPENPMKLGSIEVSTSPTSSSFSERFQQTLENKEISDSIAQYQSYFDRAPDKKLKIGIKMDGHMMGMMNTGGEMMEGSAMMMGSSMMGDGPMMGEDDSGSMGAAMGHRDGSSKIEWNDDMPAMNNMSNSENITWRLIDEETGLENDDVHWKFKVGDVVKVRIFNDPDTMHPMQHPIHFHGQRFLALSTNGEQSKNLVWKDTALVQTGDTVDLLIEISNPGEWMAHCHISEHLEAGMMIRFTATE